MSESAPKHRIETAKLYIDYFKHLTTLSSGVILIVITFTEKIFKNPADVKIAVQAIIPLGVTILMSLVGMAVMTINAHQEEWQPDSLRWLAFTFVMSALGFAGGLFFLSLPLIKVYF